MKKLLVLVLVLSMAAMAGAVTYELRAADGSTAISAVDITADSGAFTIAVVGDVSEITWTDGLYDNHNWAAAGGLFDFVTPGGVTIVTRTVGEDVLQNAGDAAAITYYTGYDGYFLAAVNVNGTPVSGDWFIIECQALAQGTAMVDNVDPITLGKTGDFSFDIVPEPMTIALLGLGGLFLRRRK